MSEKDIVSQILQGIAAGKISRADECVKTANSCQAKAEIARDATSINFYRTEAERLLMESQLLRVEANALSEYSKYGQVVTPSS